MNKDTIIKVLLAIIALMVFAWLWRIISGMLIGTLVLTTSLMPSLYFAKFAFSEILSPAKILSRTPSPTAKSSICMIMHTYTDYQRFVI